MISTPRREHGRDRRKRLTRRALKEATLDLGLERGWSEVSVEAIAERAGVSIRTFFNYFETKGDAALLDLVTVTDAELACYAHGDAESAWVDLIRLFGDDVDRAQREGQDLERHLELHHRNPALQSRQVSIFSRFEGRLSDAITTRLGGDADSRFRASMMSGAALTSVRVGLGEWSLSGRRTPLRDHVERAFAVLTPAFGPQPASGS